MATINHPRRNAFVALCCLAAKEKWCWKLACTTCGHQYFRYGLREISRGAHPDSLDWKVTAEQPDQWQRNLMKLLGPIPPLGPWTEDEGRALLSVAVAANPSELAKQVAFPDWLGYFGLVLYYSETAERQDRTLTTTWVPQFLAMLPEGASARSGLQCTLASSWQTLSWRDLEHVEAGLRTERVFGQVSNAPPFIRPRD